MSTASGRSLHSNIWTGVYPNRHHGLARLTHKMTRPTVLVRCPSSPPQGTCCVYTQLLLTHIPYPPRCYQHKAGSLCYSLVGTCAGFSSVQYHHHQTAASSKSITCPSRPQVCAKQAELDGSQQCFPETRGRLHPPAAAITHLSPGGQTQPGM